MTTIQRQLQLSGGAGASPERLTKYRFQIQIPNTDSQAPPRPAESESLGWGWESILKASPNDSLVCGEGGEHGQGVRGGESNRRSENHPLDDLRVLF